MSDNSSALLRLLGVATAAVGAVAMFSALRQADEIGNEEKRSQRLFGKSGPSSAAGSCCGSKAAAGSSSAFTTAGSDPSTNPYETQASVFEYLLMHYGGERELLNFPQLQGAQMKDATSFPKKCAEICAKQLQAVPRLAALPASELRAIDIGCAVGRSSFELTRWFGTVIGLDYSQAFIDAADKLQKEGKMSYTMRTEGDLTQSAVAQIDASLDRSRVRFVQGDACSLKLSELGGQRFHVLLAANLLCRLPFPRRFLAALPSLIETDGLVVLPSPYTWLEQYTPKSEWVGGYVDAQGKEVRSATQLQEIMEKDGHFKLIDQQDVPFFIRETARKNQWSVSHCTVWQRTNTQA